MGEKLYGEPNWRHPTDWSGKVYPPGHDTKLDHPGVRKLALEEAKTLYFTSLFHTFDEFCIKLRKEGLL